jgi:predicted DNA-binding transcriptional regulator AlpA
MKKLSIREASEKFGLSRARLYDLLARNCIAGFRSLKRGRNANPSWVDVDSLEQHIKTRWERQRTAPMVMGNDIYVSVRVAAQKTGYSRKHIYRLVRRGSISAKRPDKRTGLLVYLNDLKNFRKKVPQST